MNKKYSSKVRITMAATAVALTVGCAHHNGPRDARDPYEPMNRVFYKMNKNLDTVALRPAAMAYSWAVPAALRNVVGNVFRNVSDVPSSANALLQGDPRQAAVSAGRVVVNTLFGIGGMFEIAHHIGLERRKEDFGQTLAVWGWRDSSYLVLPLMGPGTVRDTVGVLPDAYFNPFKYLDPKIRNAYAGGRYFQARTELLEKEKVLSKAAVDEYALVRDAYYQHRNYLINNGEGDGGAVANGDFLEEGPPE